MNTEVKKTIVKKDKVKVKKTKQHKEELFDLVDELKDLNLEFEEEVKVEEEKVEEEKVEEVKVEEVDVEEEIDEEVQILLRIEKERQNLEFVRQKKALKKNAGKYAEKIQEMLIDNIEFNKKSIEESYKTIQKLSEESDECKKHLKELIHLKDEEVIMNYLADNFSDEVNEMIEEEKPKPIPKPKSKSKTNKVVEADNVTDLFQQLGDFDGPFLKDEDMVPYTLEPNKPKAKYDRVKDFKKIPNGTKMRFVYKGKEYYLIKRELSVLLENENGGGTIHPTINSATTDILNENGMKNGVNCWSVWKVNVNDKWISIGDYVLTL